MRQIVKWVLAIVCVYYYAPTVVSAQPAPCSETRGSEIVKCVATAYPDKLAARVSHDHRLDNMRFLRDRIIETARCAGLDVGRNLKRGGPSISDDFIAWRHDGITEGVDIGAAFDDPTIPLRLQWHTYGPPDYGFPFYQAYGPVSCVGGPPPAPPSVDVAQLRADIAALKAQIVNLHSALWNELEHALTERIGVERNARQKADNELGAVVLEIGSRPIPTRCGARGPFGIPIRCELK